MPQLLLTIIRRNKLNNNDRLIEMQFHGIMIKIISAAAQSMANIGEHFKNKTT